MTDVDGELEKLRAEARHRLEGEKELEDKLAAYEREIAPPPRASAASREADEDDVDEVEDVKEKPAEPVVSSSLTAQLAEAKAKETVAKVSSFSTPKLVALLAVIVFGGWIINNLIWPLIGLASLLIVCLLGYRFLRWLSSGPDDDDGKKDD